jgi:O-antigen/teichoic acid export membrane protein
MKVEKNSENKVIAKGAFINILGMAGKGLVAFYFVIITRLWGPEVMGSFYIVYVIVDIAVTFTVSGLNDGVMMFASRLKATKDKEDDLYKIIANGFVISFFFSILIIIFAFVGGPELLLKKYPDKNVVTALKNIVWSIPFVIFPVLVVSVTKSNLTMKWDALLIGFLRPFFLIIVSLLFYFADAGILGLAWAFNIAAVILSVTAFFVFIHCFELKKLLSAFSGFRIDMPLIKFSIPQNLNMTFNTFITNLDVMMLGFFGISPEIIGFYGMGAQIAKNVGQIRLAFSGSFAPLIARLHSLGEIDKMNNSFSTVSRWTSSIAFPVVIVIALFREELITIFHPSFTYDTGFILVLLLPPLINCIIGVAGNIIVMTGNSMWNLINSITVAALNAYLNWIFIPKFGIMGAACATLIASALVSFLQIVEVYFLTGARIIPSKVHKPYLAISIPLIFFAGIEVLNLADTFLQKSVFAVFSVIIYTAVLINLKFEKEDMELFSFLKIRKKRSV